MVCAIIQKIQRFKNSQIPKNSAKNERPQKPSRFAQRFLKRLLLSGAVDNSVDPNKVRLERLNINFCNETVRRNLKEIGMKAKTKVK